MWSYNRRSIAFVGVYAALGAMLVYSGMSRLGNSDPFVFSSCVAPWSAPARFMCRTEFAMRLHRPALCAKLSDLDSQLFCVEAVALYEGNPASCVSEV